MLDQIRWLFIITISLIAMITDIRCRKISNKLNTAALIVNCILLLLDWSNEYIVVGVITIFLNLILYQFKYTLGGDAKLLINIAFGIGMYTLLVYLIMVSINILTDIIVLVVNKLGKLNIKKILLGPTIFISVIISYLMVISM